MRKEQLFPALSSPLINTAMRVSGGVVRLIGTLAFAKYLAPQDYVFLVTTINTLLIASLFAGGEVHVAIMRQCIRDEEQVTRGTIAQIAQSAWPYYLLSCAGIVVFAAVSASGTTVGVVLVVLLVTEYLSSEYQRALVLNRRQIRATFLFLMRNALWLPVPMALGALCASLTLEAIFLSWMLGSLASTFLGLMWVPHSNLSGRGQGLQRLVAVRTGLKYVCSSFITRSWSVVDKWYVMAFIDPVTGAKYAFLSTLLNVIPAVLIPLTIDYAKPHLLMIDKASRRVKRLAVSRLRLITYALVAFLCLVMVLLAPHFGTLANVKLSIFEHTFLIVAVSSCSRCINLTEGTILYAAAQDDQNLKSAVIATAISVLCGLLLWWSSSAISVLYSLAVAPAVAAYMKALSVQRHLSNSI